MHAYIHMSFDYGSGPHLLVTACGDSFFFSVVRTCTHTSVHICTHTNIHMYIHMHTYMQTHTFIETYTYLRSHTFLHTYVHTEQASGSLLVRLKNLRIPNSWNPSMLRGSLGLSQAAPQPGSQAHDSLVLSTLRFSGPLYILFCTVPYCSVLFWSWNPGCKSACGEPPWS